MGDIKQTLSRKVITKKKWQQKSTGMDAYKKPTPSRCLCKKNPLKNIYYCCFSNSDCVVLTSTTDFTRLLSTQEL